MDRTDHGHPESDALTREIAGEQSHVDRVYSQLGVAQRTAEEAAVQGNQIYQIDRADFAREEDSTAIFERDVFTFQAAKRLKVLESEAEGLVFGRLDGDDDVRYIGRIGVRDDDYEPLVIDWRAPAAEPFYRATSAAPMGMQRRRVLRCKGTRVVGIEDDQLDPGTTLPIIGDGALMAALTRARGHQMKDIVATIQAEQDEAIRAPYQGITFIGGGPGTGKTVVALHRAAYLLYSNRRRFENGGVLVVGPSAIFMNYIERVLPSLGEDSVTLRAIGAVASDVIRVRSERVDTPMAATVKGSLAMAGMLRRLVAEPLMDTQQDLRVSLKGEILILTPAELARIRTEVLSTHAMNKSRRLVERELLDALWEKRPEQVEVEREIFDDLVRDQARFTMFVNGWWPVLTPESVLARLVDPEVVSRVAKRDLSPEQVTALAQSYQDVDPEAARWSVADTALLDELYALLGPAPVETDDYDPTQFLEEGSDVAELVSTTDRLYSRQVEDDPDDDGHETYAHVLVDEAQDITPMQWRMLRRRGAQASWTIVGDPAQSSWPIPAETERAIRDLIGNAPHRTFRMSTNYRSPAEVFELAGAMIARHQDGVDMPTPVRRTGIDPLLLIATEQDWIAEAMARTRHLLEQVEGTVGIIATQERLDALADAVAALPQAERLALVTPLGCKGLEYDGVLVVDPDGIVEQTSGGHRVLYVALTRPTQLLVTLDVDDERRPGQWRPTT